LVAVKVQRPFVLETVTIDLFIIRNLGLALRKFPQASKILESRDLNSDPYLFPKDEMTLDSNLEILN